MFKTLAFGAVAALGSIPWAMVFGPFFGGPRLNRRNSRMQTQAVPVRDMNLTSPYDNSTILAPIIAGEPVHHKTRTVPAPTQSAAPRPG